MKAIRHLLTGLLVAQLGAGTSGALGGTSVGGRPLAPDPVGQVNRSVQRPLPRLDPPPVRAPDRVWVPDRHIPTLDGRQVFVPGHWERRVSPGETYVPPQVVCTPEGECATVPGGVRRAPELRHQEP